MQTWITDYDFYKSANNLDNKRLFANIYEAIHILSSLLNVNNKLVNPKRNVSNHPVSKLWVGYEKSLLNYIMFHLKTWCIDRKYKSNINKKNYDMLAREIFYNEKNEKIKKQDESNKYWITDNLIKTHKSILINKNNNYRKLWPNIPDNLPMHYNWRQHDNNK
jgi:hypothetical protein